MINILGINISTLGEEEVLEKMGQFLEDGKQHYIVTPNPEIILEAHRDEELFYILNKADLAIPDGAGLKFAAWAMGKNLRRVTGADLISDLRFKNLDLRIAVANWKDGLSKKEDIEKVLREAGVKDFFVKDVSREVGQNLDDLVKFKPDILFCTLGAPYQEKFIYHNLKSLPTVKVAIGVGGAFDFLTGKIKRAPKIMRWLCLEWLWRLAKQPHRAKRIYQAVIVFPWEFIKWRFIHHLFYRRSVVCLLYKKDSGQYQILLLERISQTGHWQLPQGGIDDGESGEEAIRREMKEEIGTNNFNILGKFKDIYKYKWPKNYSHGGYKGQKQTLYILEFKGDDSDIKLCYWEHKEWKWVNIENLTKEAHEVHRTAYGIFLEKFKGVVDN
ncbi:MAG: WecB/TagA/CpsF family glycosyltransferase [Patescibacteria group bacterium]